MLSDHNPPSNSNELLRQLLNDHDEQNEEKESAAIHSELTSIVVTRAQTLQEQASAIADAFVEFDNVMSSGRKAGRACTAGFLLSLFSTAAFSYLYADDANGHDDNYFYLIGAMLSAIVAMPFGIETAAYCSNGRSLKIEKHTGATASTLAITEHPNYLQAENAALKIIDVESNAHHDPYAIRNALISADSKIKAELDVYKMRQPQRLAFFSGGYVRKNSSSLSPVQTFFKQLDNRKNGARDTICKHIFEYAGINLEQTNKVIKIK